MCAGSPLRPDAEYPRSAGLMWGEGMKSRQVFQEASGPGDLTCLQLVRATDDFPLGNHVIRMGKFLNLVDRSPYRGDTVAVLVAPELANPSTYLSQLGQPPLVASPFSRVGLLPHAQRSAAGNSGAQLIHLLPACDMGADELNTMHEAVTRPARPGPNEDQRSDSFHAKRAEKVPTSFVHSVCRCHGLEPSHARSRPNPRTEEDIFENDLIIGDGNEERLANDRATFLDVETDRALSAGPS